MKTNEPFKENTAGKTTDNNSPFTHTSSTDRTQYHNALEQAPIGFCILSSDNYTVLDANRTYLQLVDKTTEQMVGKPLFEALPELEHQGIDELLRGVITTGKAYLGNEFRIEIKRNNQRETAYFNFIYQPYISETGTCIGVIVIANEITSVVEAKHAIVESERQFRNLVTHSPVAMAIFRGPEWVIEMANHALLETLWKRSLEEVQYRKLMDVFPELEGQPFPQLLSNVFNTGIPHKEKEALAYIQTREGLLKLYLDFVYAPLFESDGSVSGIMVTVTDVSDKVQVRERIRDAEERLRLATEAAGIATWDLNLLTGDIIYSQRLTEIFGYNKHTVVLNHSQLRQHVHPDDLKNVLMPAFERAKETGIYTYEARIIWSDKSIHWIRTQGKIMFDDGKPVRMLGTMLDITEQRLFGQELEESEKKLNIAVETAELGTWEYNLINNNVECSPRFAGMFGYATCEELSHQDLTKLIVPGDVAIREKAHNDALITGVLDYEMRVLGNDGVLRWLKIKGKVFYNDEGKPERMLGSALDITHQKSTEDYLEKIVKERTAALKLSEERNHRMVSEIQDYAILVLNRDGYIQNWNKGAEKIKGYKEEEVKGKHLSIFYTPEDCAAGLPARLLKQALETGRAANEGWRKRKDGTKFWASVVITALHNEEDEVIGFSKVTRDLTEIKLAENKLQEKTTDLEKANAALAKSNSELEQFAYIASHDLQEPLRKIRFFSERLEKVLGNLDDTSQLYFFKIQQAALRMQNLIKDLLDFSRLSQTGQSFVQIDLNDVLQNIRNDFELLVQQKNAIVEIGNMPVIEAVGLQMQQLFYNLISNALKFLRPDVQPVISVHASVLTAEEMQQHPDLNPRIKHYCIAVRDNGIGFNQKYAEQIFVIFQRLNDIQSYSGTGIGLALCKKIVLNHGGKIFADSTENEGSVFYIILPEQHVIVTV